MPFHLIRKLSVAVVIAGLQACSTSEKPSASTDSTSGGAEIDAQAQGGQARASGAAADTALSAGVGSLGGSIDSALAATAQRIRPAARARQMQLPPLVAVRRINAYEFTVVR